MNKTIAILAGDGIGPEIMREAVRVLKAVEERFGHTFVFKEALVGGAAWEATGRHFPEETRTVCTSADAILFGSVGGPVSEQSSPKWAGCERESILAVRSHFGFNINLRPVPVYPDLVSRCPLRSELIRGGVDILCVRELAGDIYFGEHATEMRDGLRAARDVMTYDESAIAAAAHAAFKAARQRRKTVVSVDKANVLDCSKLWRAVVTEVARGYPDCSLEHLLVDNAAMQVIRRPADFDVLLLPNMFGDILSDEVSVFAGSLGMLPSASLNAQGFGLYEPSGGSAPDIAGRGIANPIGQILSAALMLLHSFGLRAEHDAIFHAVGQAIAAGARTGDIAAPGEMVLTTEQMGAVIFQKLTSNL